MTVTAAATRPSSSSSPPEACGGAVARPPSRIALLHFPPSHGRRSSRFPTCSLTRSPLSLSLSVCHLAPGIGFLTDLGQAMTEAERARASGRTIDTFFLFPSLVPSFRVRSLQRRRRPCCPCRLRPPRPIAACPRRRRWLRTAGRSRSVSRLLAMSVILSAPLSLFPSPLAFATRRRRRPSPSPLHCFDAF